MSDMHNLQYYLQCLIGGTFACGITHTAIVTLDLLKCLKQVDSKQFKSFSDGFK
jgi:solute carrier family 25 phosphate transporter 3